MKRLCAAVLIGVFSLAWMVPAATIATVELEVRDGQGGLLLASSGPSPWVGDGYAEVTDIPMGSGRALSVLCRDVAGHPIYRGQMLGIEVFAKDPFSLTGFLSVAGNGLGGMDVLLNGFVWLGTFQLEEIPPEVVAVPVDIKPGSAENPLNLKARGDLPVVIPGSAVLNVATIDRATVLLAGVAPVRIQMADVASVSPPAVSPDGYPDLVIHFPIQALAAAVAPARDGDVLGLLLRGEFTDGSAFEGTDQVTILAKPAAR